jgi:hypothetical protein
MGFNTLLLDHDRRYGRGRMPPVFCLRSDSAREP